MVNLLAARLGNMYDSLHEDHQNHLRFCRYSPVARLSVLSVFWRQRNSVICLCKFVWHDRNIKDANYARGIMQCVRRSRNESIVIEYEKVGRAVRRYFGPTELVW